jgi:prevent-host-death family protein
LNLTGTMSETVNISEARAHLSQLVERAARGEDVIIARAGRPVARLVAFCTPANVRKPGRMRGRIQIADNFDAPLPDDLFRAG